MTSVNANEATAIVTGHSRGIGAAIAEQLLSRGARVLGLSRHANEPLATRFPDKLEQHALDVADGAAVQQWLDSGAMAAFAGAGVAPLLVNNAGVLQPIGPLQTQRAELVWRAVSVNVAAVFALSAAFVQETSNAPERRILHVSSGAGRKPYAGWSIYCATKAAIDQHARCVALDRTPNLLISSVAPGVVDTEMQAEIRASDDEHFPDRPRFVAMHRDKALPSPDQTGGRLVEYLLSDVFGREAVFDLRDFLPT
jgi:benzil reductase ((S)-benzoin forming)